MELKDLLKESCILMDAPLKTKDEVFRALSGELEEAGIVADRDQFQEGGGIPGNPF